jgi:hypothetical protein
MAGAIAELVEERARDFVFGFWLIAALGASVVLNFDMFYRDMPREVQPALIALTIGGLQKSGGDTTILTGRTSDGNLCQVLLGYEIDTSRVLRFQSGALVEQCPPDTPIPASVQPAPTANVTVLIAPGDVVSAQTCTRTLEPLVVSPSGAETLWAETMWAITIAVAPGSPATFLTRLASQVKGMCPALAALPPN